MLFKFGIVLLFSSEVSVIVFVITLETSLTKSNTGSKTFSHSPENFVFLANLAILFLWSGLVIMLLRLVFPNHLCFNMNTTLRLIKMPSLPDYSQYMCFCFYYKYNIFLELLFRSVNTKVFLFLFSWCPAYLFKIIIFHHDHQRPQVYFLYPVMFDWTDIFCD